MERRKGNRKSYATGYGIVFVGAFCASIVVALPLGAIVDAMHRIRALLLLVFFVCHPALACEYPDEGNMPLRRALARVQMLPETREWDVARRDLGELVQYELSLRETLVKGGRCYWTVRARSNGALWRTFYVTPDGKSVLKE